MRGNLLLRLLVCGVGGAVCALFVGAIVAVCLPTRTALRQDLPFDVSPTASAEQADLFLAEQAAALRAALSTHEWLREAGFALSVSHPQTHAVTVTVTTVTGADAAIAPFLQAVYGYAQQLTAPAQDTTTAASAVAQLRWPLPAPHREKLAPWGGGPLLPAGAAAIGVSLGLAVAALRFPRSMTAATTVREKPEAPPPSTPRRDESQECQNTLFGQDEAEETRNVGGPSAEATAPRSWQPDCERLATQVAALVETDHGVLIVVAPLTEEGGSPRPAVNLAIYLVKMGLAVLLVDTETTQKDMQTVFELPAGPGFNEFIASLGQQIPWSYSHLTGLAIMTAGANGRAAPLPAGDQAGHLACWQVLRKNFGVTILYSRTPLGGNQPPSGRSTVVKLIHAADGVIAVARRPQEAEPVGPWLTGLSERFLGVLTLENNP